MVVMEEEKETEWKVEKRGWQEEETEVEVEKEE